MCLCAIGEPIVGPVLVAGDSRLPGGGLTMSSCSGRGSTLNHRTPVFRGVGDSPDISVRIESDTDQEGLPVVSQRQTTGHARRHTPAAGQITQENWGLYLQGARAPKPASLAAYDHGYTPLSKGANPVQAGHGDGDLHADPRASSHRLGGQYFHLAILSGLGSPVVRVPLPSSSVTDYEGDFAREDLGPDDQRNHLAGLFDPPAGL
jgi:hypothetical protein